MTIEKLLDNALDYIYLLAGEEDWICEELLQIPEEREICLENCDTFCKDCIKRYLKNYKKEKQ